MGSVPELLTGLWTATMLTFWRETDRWSFNSPAPPPGLSLSLLPVARCISHLANLLEKDYCQGFGIWSCPTHVAWFPSVLFPPAAPLFTDGRNRETNEHRWHQIFLHFETLPFWKDAETVTWDYWPALDVLFWPFEDFLVIVLNCIFQIEILSLLWQHLKGLSARL